jgi:hypothetical protein
VSEPLTKEGFSRVRIYLVGYPDLVDLFREMDGTRIHTAACLPEDAQIGAIFADEYNNQLAIKVWSASFDLVERGRPIPRFDLLIQSKPAFDEPLRIEVVP